MRLTASERRIWEATYAAAWVDLMRAAQDKGGATFDEATLSHSETAITVADRAVLDLRRWQTQEQKVVENHGAPAYVRDRFWEEAFERSSRGE